MNHWQRVLNVTEDADLAAVKKAYARLIKQFRPETHPQEFAELRLAYEQARKYLKQSKRTSTSHFIPGQARQQNWDQHPDDVVPQAKESGKEPIPEQFDEQTVAWDEAPKQQREEPPVETYLSWEHETTQAEEQAKEPPLAPLVPYEKPPEQPLPPEEEAEVPEFLECLDILVARRYKRELINELFNHPQLNQWDSLAALNFRVFEWLLANLRLKGLFLPTKMNIPLELIGRLDALFQWSLRERELAEKFSHYDSSLLLYALREAKKKPSNKEIFLKNISALGKQLWGTVHGFLGLGFILAIQSIFVGVLVGLPMIFTLRNFWILLIVMPLVAFYWVKVTSGHYKLVVDNWHSYRGLFNLPKKTRKKTEPSRMFSVIESAASVLKALWRMLYRIYITIVIVCGHVILISLAVGLVSDIMSNTEKALEGAVALAILVLIWWYLGKVSCQKVCTLWNLKSRLIKSGR